MSEDERPIIEEAGLKIVPILELRVRIVQSY